MTGVCINWNKAVAALPAVQEDANSLEQVQAEKEAGEREAEEVRRQMEEDADEEIEALKNGCAAVGPSCGCCEGMHLCAGVPVCGPRSACSGRQTCGCT